MANRPSKKCSTAVPWNLGAWVMGQASGVAVLQEAIDRTQQQILNRRSSCHSHAPRRVPAEEVKWEEVCGEGTKVELERRGAQASQWGFFESSDAARALQKCSVPAGTAAVLAAWSSLPQFNNPASATRVDTRAYLVVWDDRGATKHAMPDFSQRLWEAIEGSPENFSMDACVARSLAQCFDALSKSPSAPLRAWVAQHRADALEGILSQSPSIRGPGPRF